MLTNLHSDIAWRPRTAAEGPGPGLILAPCLFGQQRAHGGPAPPEDHLATLLGTDARRRCGTADPGLDVGAGPAALRA